MSGSVRKELRHYIVNRMKKIGPDVGGRIYANPTLPLWGNEKVLGGKEFPAILVYTRREDAEVFDVSPRTHKRTLALAVEVVAQLNNELDDLLDDICAQVEFVFNEDQTLAELCEYVELASTEMTLSKEPSNRILGSAVMTFNIVYLTYAVASGEVEPNLLTELKRINMDWRPAGAFADTPTEKDGLAFDT